MSRYDHKIETSLEGIEHLSKEKREEKERKMNRAPSLIILNIKYLGFRATIYFVKERTEEKLQLQKRRLRRRRPRKR